MTNYVSYDNMISETKIANKIGGKNMKKVWIVVTSFNDIPKILGVYSTKEKAEKIAYTQKFWCNVIEKEIDK